MNVKTAIKNLDMISHAIERAANKPENYNTDWAQYLEQMSWSLHKHANDLRDMAYLLDVTQVESMDA